MASITDKLRTYLFKNGKWVLVTSRKMLYDGCYVKQVESGKKPKYYKVHKILDDDSSRYWFENIRYSNVEAFEKAKQVAKKYAQKIISKRDDFLVVQGVDKSDIEKYRINTNLSGFSFDEVKSWFTDLWKGTRHLATETWKGVTHIGHTVDEIGKDIGKAIHWIGKHWVTIVIVIVAIICIYAVCAYAAEVGLGAIMSSAESAAASAASSAVSAGAEMIGQVADQYAFQWIMSKLYNEPPQKVAEEGGDPQILSTVGNYANSHGLSEQEILNQTYQYVAKYSGQFMAAGFKKPEQAVVYVLKVNHGAPPDPNEIITDYLIITPDGKVYPKYKIVNGNPVLNEALYKKEIPVSQVETSTYQPVQQTQTKASVMQASIDDTTSAKNKVFIYAALAALALGLFRNDGGKGNG